MMTRHRKLEPAMTPEEWAKWLQPAPVGIDQPPEYRMAIAAMSLAGQPFGFTWDDVDVLDDALHSLHGPKMDALRNDTERGLQSIRDRIAALLPPREVE